MSQQELLVTLEGAGERLALSRSAIYRLIKKGAIPSVKVGGSRRVRVRDLEVFAERLANGEESDDDAR